MDPMSADSIVTSFTDSDQTSASPGISRMSSETSVSTQGDSALDVGAVGAVVPIPSILDVENAVSVRETPSANADIEGDEDEDEDDEDDEDDDDDDVSMQDILRLAGVETRGPPEVATAVAKSKSARPRPTGAPPAKLPTSASKSKPPVKTGSTKTVGSRTKA
ncbi:hypothetical protein PsYK624_055460 [Phanerochaete sordida]|uniref:Uncharacterized protein n=1 Tax=Phanerochaete sordida TaxID=48140 RepID=A0A9P3G8K5_9APHY|nr:hypothetical protein PsYK624_055460 [Phanerochaete sordida]